MGTMELVSLSSVLNVSRWVDFRAESGEADSVAEGHGW
jgi:hypothetical protein